MCIKPWVESHSTKKNGVWQHRLAMLTFGGEKSEDQTTPLRGSGHGDAHL